MTYQELEMSILLYEGIRVVFRKKRHEKATTLDSYPNKKGHRNDVSVMAYLIYLKESLIKDIDIDDIVVVRGDGSSEVNGLATLGYIRESYRR